MNTRNSQTLLLTMMLATFACMARAAALSAARDTPARMGDFMEVTAAAQVWQGGLTGVWTNGLAIAAADDAAITVIGRAENSAAAGERVKIRRGIFRFANGGEFTDAHAGQFAYVEDDATVTTAALATHDRPAGIIVDVDSAGVWVDCSVLARAMAGNFDALAVVGNGTVGGTLDVTGAATFGSTLDADSVTVDAGAGLDTQAAGELKIGAATATSLTLGAADITTSVAGPLAAPRMALTRLDETELVLTSAHYGTMICVSNTAAVAITLPANGAAAGAWVDVSVYSGSTDGCAPTISAATADTLVGPNDVDLKSVTWGTGHRIGAYARFWSDGAYWHAVNLGGTTMTYTD